MELEPSPNCIWMSFLLNFSITKEKRVILQNEFTQHNLYNKNSSYWVDSIFKNEKKIPKFLNFYLLFF